MQWDNKTVQGQCATPCTAKDNPYNYKKKTNQTCLFGKTLKNV